MEIYSEMILFHSRTPRNFKVLENEEYFLGINPMCGDDYSFQKSINDIGFTGRGCAISKASFSIMTTLVKGLTISEAIDLKDRAIKFFHGEDVDVPSDLLVFSEIHKYPARVKCATLAWRTLEDALNKVKND